MFSDIIKVGGGGGEKKGKYFIFRYDELSNISLKLLQNYKKQNKNN